MKTERVWDFGSEKKKMVHGRKKKKERMIA
jgi:hypothetical protein